MASSYHKSYIVIRQFLIILFQSILGILTLGLSIFMVSILLISGVAIDSFSLPPSIHPSCLSIYLSIYPPGLILNGQMLLLPQR